VRFIHRDPRVDFFRRGQPATGWAGCAAGHGPGANAREGARARTRDTTGQCPRAGGSADSITNGCGEDATVCACDTTRRGDAPRLRDRA
jgi:hypothetical protein